MAFEWKDKILLITGASNGIGASVIRLALEEGAQQVFNLDIDEKSGIAVQNELNERYGDTKVKFVECDVTKEEQLKTNFESMLSNQNNNYVVINNAGIFNDSLQTYKNEIDLNVTALVTGSLIALDMMRKDKGGKGGTIINISSAAALCLPPYTPIYNATKSAVLAFSASLGADDYYKRSQVRVLTICFGLTDTSLVTLERVGTFDAVMEKRFTEFLSNRSNQSVQSAARGVIDMFKQGVSASVWLSHHNKPVQDITNIIRKAYDILSEPLLT